MNKLVVVEIVPAIASDGAMQCRFANILTSSLLFFVLSLLLVLGAGVAGSSGWLTVLSLLDSLAETLSLGFFWAGGSTVAAGNVV